MWVEFGWGSLPVLLLIGFLHGYVWRGSQSSPGRATALYAILLSLSLYLVMQTLEAMAFRFLVMAVPMAIAWRIAAPSRRSEPG